MSGDDAVHIVMTPGYPQESLSQFLLRRLMLTIFHAGMVHSKHHNVNIASGNS